MTSRKSTTLIITTKILYIRDAGISICSACDDESINGKRVFMSVNKSGPIPTEFVLCRSCIDILQAKQK